MRSIWKGHIRFSLVTIPVRIYNAIDSTQAVHFNQLHKEDGGPVGYQKICKLDNKVLTGDEIVKGYQFEKDQYVIVDPEDLERVKLKTTKIIEVEGFIDKSEIPPTLYDSAYYAGPDGEVSSKSYSLLRQALEDSGKIAVGKVVLRDREDIVALAPHRNGLVMFKLHYPKEIRSISEVPQLDALQEADENALKLAHHLIDSMATSISKIEMKDRYTDALREIFQAKIEGKEVVEAAEKETPTVDIMAALKESIEQIQAQRKPMVKATGTAKASDETEEAEAADTESEEHKDKAGKSRKRKAG
ncbi:MAG TPA: Ku protein [Blastocatellia bacterium]|nr:Ku protein [Blastocatellia bacterium]